jgi:hypothetical protein
MRCRRAHLRRRLFATSAHNARVPNRLCTADRNTRAAAGIGRTIAGGAFFRAKSGAPAARCVRGGVQSGAPAARCVRGGVQIEAPRVRCDFAADTR